MRTGQRGAVAIVLGAAAFLSAACGGALSSARPPAHASSTSAPHPTQPPPPSTTTTTTVPAEPGWTVLASEPTGVAVDARTVVVTDGTTVRVIRFRAHQVRFDLHVGTEDPPSVPGQLPANAQPAISATEAPHLLAAFNGGFKSTAAAGGVEVDGHTLTPLVGGMASLVLGSGGTASIGVWGSPGFPPAGVQVTSVRQNLPPLVAGGAPSARAATWGAWGATLGGGAYVARSALGEDGAGDVLYAASMSTVPLDLAQALVHAGANVGMELDINPEWVQADVAPSPGGALAAEVPSQNRPADQYQTGWTRDFVAVLATS